MEAPQLIYPSITSGSNEFHPYFVDEINALENVGFNVATKPAPFARKLLLRSFAVLHQRDFPSDNRYMVSWEQYQMTRNMVKYYTFLHDLMIPSFVVPKLDGNTVVEIKARGWDRAFIRSSVKSLYHQDDIMPIWPDYDINQIAKVYREYRENMPPPFIVRKYVGDDLLMRENRYWVLNHNVYHQSGVMPQVVQQAVERMRPFDCPYYVIDALPDMIVELNSGVSADRYGENSPETFASWFKEEFLK